MNVPFQFNLKFLFIHMVMVAMGMGLVLHYADSIYVYIIYSAIYSIVFVWAFSKLSHPVRGLIGASLGWGLSILFSVFAELLTYVNGSNEQLLFDGDGSILGAIWIPLFAFFFMLPPIAAMGTLIGGLGQYFRLPTRDVGAVRRISSD